MHQPLSFVLLLLLVGGVFLTCIVLFTSSNLFVCYVLDSIQRILRLSKGRSVDPALQPPQAPRDKVAYGREGKTEGRGNTLDESVKSGEHSLLCNVCGKDNPHVYRLYNIGFYGHKFIKLECKVCGKKTYPLPPEATYHEVVRLEEDKQRQYSVLCKTCERHTLHVYHIEGWSHYRSIWWECTVCGGNATWPGDVQIPEEAKMAMKLGHEEEIQESLAPETVGRMELEGARKEGDLDRAIAEYREALRLNPKNENAHVYLGAALAAKGDLDGAMAEEREALRLNPNNEKAHYLLGMVLERGGNDEEALGEYRAAHELDPENPAYRQGYERLSKRMNH